MISGLFFGFAFGMGGIGAAVLGKLADVTSIIFVYKVCAYLPAIGLLTGLLPSSRKRAPAHQNLELPTRKQKTDHLSPCSCHSNYHACLLTNPIIRTRGQRTTDR